MKRFIIFGSFFAICWLGIVSGLDANDCPHCFKPGTNGTKPYVCKTKGQCPCRHGHTNPRCAGCLPGFHPNGRYCCEKTKYHIGNLKCKDCECNPDGVKKDMFKQCNGQGICTCRDGYGGEKCFEPSAQEVDVNGHKFGAVIRVYCNGKCKLHYIRAKTTQVADLSASDQPYYANDDDYPNTDGDEFCSGSSPNGGGNSECKDNGQDIDGYEFDEFYIRVMAFGHSRYVKVQFHADNYLRKTVKFYDFPSDLYDY